MSLNNVCGALIESGFLTSANGTGSVELTNTPAAVGNLLVATVVTNPTTAKATWQSLGLSSVVGTDGTGALVANGALTADQTALGDGVVVGAGANGVTIGALATGSALANVIVVGHGAKAPAGLSTAGSIVLGVDATGGTPPTLASLCLPSAVGNNLAAVEALPTTAWLRVWVGGTMGSVRIPCYL